MNRRFQRPAICLFVLLVLASCTSSPAPHSTVPSTIPSTVSPWPGVDYYFDPTGGIDIEAGKQFAIGFQTYSRLGLIWEETHDQSFVSLKEKADTGPSALGLWNPSPTDTRASVTWFLFEALHKGDTEIHLRYSHGGTVLPNDIRDQRVLTVHIN